MAQVFEISETLYSVILGEWNTGTAMVFVCLLYE